MIVKSIANLPKEYDILDNENNKICTCRPLLQKHKNSIQFKILQSQSLTENTLLLIAKNINIESFYDYINYAVIDWLLYDLLNNKIQFNKNNVLKYLDISLLIYIASKIVLKLSLFIKESSIKN